MAMCNASTYVKSLLGKYKLLIVYGVHSGEDSTLQDTSSLERRNYIS